MIISSFQDRPCWHWRVGSRSPHEAWEIGTDWRWREGTWNSRQAEKFFRELRALRFFDWDFEYNAPVCDGYSWSAFVKFSHPGAYFCTQANHAVPPNFENFIKLLRRHEFHEIRYVDLPSPD